MLRGLTRICLQQALVIEVETDILFPIEQQAQIVEGLRRGGTDVHFASLPSPQGHNAFLVDYPRFCPLIAGFMAG